MGICTAHCIVTDATSHHPPHQRFAGASYEKLQVSSEGQGFPLILLRGIM
jgi:hypothetical protein